MANANVLGALKVILGGDTSGLDKSLKDSKSGLDSFAKVAKASLALASAAATAAAVTIGTAIKTQIDNADKVNKITQSTGTTTEEWSKLSYAAGLADVSNESLSKSLGKLSKNMASAAVDGAGPAGHAFAALGVNVKNTDGTLRSSSDVLSDVSGKFAGYTDGAAKTAMAIALFGKSGAEMIPLLNLGKQGLSDAADEAQRYGLVLDKNTTLAAEAFNDNLKRMEKINEGMIVQITARMLPSFEQLSEAMLKAKESGTVLNTVADLISGTMKFMASVVIITSDIIKSLGRDFGMLFDVIAAGAQLKFGVASDVISKWKDETKKDTLETKGLMSTLWDDVPEFNWNAQLTGIRAMNKEVLAIAGEWGKVAAPIIASENATKSALETFLNSQAKRTAAATAEAETIGKSVGEQAKLKLAYEAEAIALANKIPLNAQNNLLIAQAGDAAALAAMKIVGANATVQAMNPAEQYQSQMDQLKKLYDAGVISLETYGARQQQIAQQAGMTWDIAGASIAGSFSKIAGAFGNESSKMAKVAQIFGVVQGTIAMYTGAAQALTLTFPANIAAVAAVLAKGATLIASIKSQSIPTGYMTGGSFTVGGGGGPDSTPVSFMASPGEQVDIWRPDQGGGKDPRGGAKSSTVIRLSTDELARPFIEKLIPALNEAIRDGHRIELATGS